MNKARTEYAHRRSNKPLETRKNQNELLLQEDPLIFMLSCEHMFTSSNFTPGAHPSATSEGTRSATFLILKGVQDASERSGVPASLRVAMAREPLNQPSRFGLTSAPQAL